MSVEVVFVEVDAVRLVDCTTVGDVETLVVEGCHVRLSLRLTPEERAQTDIKALVSSLRERGALRVVDATQTVRDAVSDVSTTTKVTSSERGVETLRKWLKGSGEDPDVVEGSLVLLDELVDR